MKQENKKQNREKVQKKKKKYLIQQTQKFQNIVQKVGSFQVHMNQIIGQGTYGKVYKAYLQEDQQKKTVYACKVIKKQKLDNLQLYNKEYAKQIHDRLKRQGQFQLSLHKCPNIARMHQTSQTQKAYYYIMEYCQTDLAKLLKKKRFLELGIALKYFCQILEGIKFIYEKNAFHRDLKPENLLIKDDVIKISDFGFVKIFTQIEKQCKSGRNKFRTQSKVGTRKWICRSKEQLPSLLVVNLINSLFFFFLFNFFMQRNFNQIIKNLKSSANGKFLLTVFLCQRLSLSHSVVGTYRYMSPDILNLLMSQSQTEGSGGLDYLPQKSDVWSLGIILYKMLYGKQPYDGKDQNQMLKKINQDELQFPNVIQIQPKEIQQSNVPSKLIRLMKKMIQKDPVERITFLQLYKQVHQIVKKMAKSEKKSSIQPQKQEKAEQQNNNSKEKLLNAFQQIINMIDYDCINHATIREIGISEYVEFSYKLITLLHQKRTAFIRGFQVSSKIKEEIQSYQKKFYHQVKTQCNLKSGDKLSHLLMKVYECLKKYQDFDQLQRDVQVYLLFLLLLLSFQINVITQDYLLIMTKKAQSLKSKRIQQSKRDSMENVQKYLKGELKQKSGQQKKIKQRHRQSKSKQKTKDKTNQKQKFNKTQKNFQQTQKQSEFVLKTDQNQQKKVKKQKRSKSKQIRQSSSRKQE